MSGSGSRGGHRALSDCYGMEKDNHEHATGARMKPRPGRTGQAIAEKVQRHGGELALRAGFADDSHRMLCMEESFGLSGAGAGSMGKMPPSRAAGYDAALPVSGMLAQLWRERTEGALREDVEGDMAGAGIWEGASARNLEAHLSHLEQAVSSRYFEYSGRTGPLDYERDFPQFSHSQFPSPHAPSVAFSDSLSQSATYNADARHYPTTRARRHDARAPAPLLREHDDPGAALVQGRAKDPAAARKLQLDLDARARFMQDMVFSTLLGD